MSYIAGELWSFGLVRRPIWLFCGHSMGHLMYVVNVFVSTTASMSNSWPVEKLFEVNLTDSSTGVVCLPLFLRFIPPFFLCLWCYGMYIPPMSQTLGLHVSRYSTYLTTRASRVITFVCEMGWSGYEIEWYRGWKSWLTMVMVIVMTSNLTENMFDKSQLFTQNHYWIITLKAYAFIGYERSVCYKRGEAVG